MKAKLSESQIEKIANHISKKSEEMNEGWFSNLFKNDDYDEYSHRIENMMEKIISNIYYDKDLISEVRSLYTEIQNSDIDRRKKHELLDIMYEMYQTLEMSKKKLEFTIHKLRRLK